MSSRGDGICPASIPIGKVVVTGKDRCLHVAPVGEAREGSVSLNLPQAELNAIKNTTRIQEGQYDMRRRLTGFDASRCCCCCCWDTRLKKAFFSRGGVRSAEPITGQVYGRLVVPNCISSNTVVRSCARVLVDELCIESVPYLEL